MRNSNYTREFRDSSVQLVMNSEESTAKIAKDLKDKEFTHPALLAGLENYTQMLDLMSMFNREELLDMKQELVKIMRMDI